MLSGVVASDWNHNQKGLQDKAVLEVQAMQMLKRHRSRSGSRTGAKSSSSTKNESSGKPSKRSNSPESFEVVPSKRSNSGSSSPRSGTTSFQCVDAPSEAPTAVKSEPKDGTSVGADFDKVSHADADETASLFSSSSGVCGPTSADSGNANPPLFS